MTQPKAPKDARLTEACSPEQGISAKVVAGAKSGVHEIWLGHGEEIVAGPRRHLGAAGREGGRQRARELYQAPSGSTMFISVPQGSLICLPEVSLSYAQTPAKCSASLSP